MKINKPKRNFKNVNNGMGVGYASMAFIMTLFYFVSSHLKKPLEYYMSRYEKVRIIRAKQRVGSIRARTLAMSAATAPVITVLDSHCECFPGKMNYFIYVILCLNAHGSVSF